MQQLKLALRNLSLELICLDSIDSTNNFLKTYVSSKEYVACCSETQTNGKGRHNRQWVSPYGVNIYLSLRCSINRAPRELKPLSIQTALSCLAAFKKNAIFLPIKIKWPNDLMYEGKKLGGILIEIIEATHAKSTIIIGIGLNINQTPNLINDPKPLTSLFAATGKLYNRNTLIAFILAELINLIPNYCLLDQQESLRNVDYLQGKLIKLKNGNTIISGKAAGITAQGELIVVADTNERFICASGEAQILVEA
ncbi:MAG: biotin--[acetyl-CoA-carboxylase] ligase [Legionellales bacterium RIFCSPHIGHO2_12_FULL_37_14]|nr:MAG: biotin--[acetyl-CoA-carboxylase] ligase [Legionellales bacterium RIFCSPHIGHO2_12_FULL_37_14]